MNDSYEPFTMTQPIVSECFAAIKQARQLGPDEEPSLAYQARAKHPDVVLVVSSIGSNGREWKFTIPSYVLQEILGDSRALAEKVVTESDKALQDANEAYAELQAAAAALREERAARADTRRAELQRIDL